tara:strand:+ start:494 stop:832 length:339 start_codon:yes stop_codon:yes gene_type:complete
MKSFKTIVEANQGSTLFPRDDLEYLNRVLYWAKIEIKNRQAAVKALKANDYKVGDVIVFFDTKASQKMAQGTITKLGGKASKTVTVIPDSVYLKDKPLPVNKVDITGFIKRA